MVALDCCDHRLCEECTRRWVLWREAHTCPTCRRRARTLSRVCTARPIPLLPTPFLDDLRKAGLADWDDKLIPRLADLEDGRLCYTCWDGGTLIVCSTAGCEFACHPACCEPPLKRVPRGAWYRRACRPPPPPAPGTPPTPPAAAAWDGGALIAELDADARAIAALLAADAAGGARRRTARPSAPAAPPPPAAPPAPTLCTHELEYRGGCFGCTLPVGHRGAHFTGIVEFAPRVRLHLFATSSGVAVRHHLERDAAAQPVALRSTRSGREI